MKLCQFNNFQDGITHGQSKARARPCPRDCDELQKAGPERHDGGNDMQAEDAAEPVIMRRPTMKNCTDLSSNRLRY
jgi:hypothetical protein